MDAFLYWRSENHCLLDDQKLACCIHCFDVLGNQSRRIASVAVWVKRLIGNGYEPVRGQV